MTASEKLMSGFCILCLTAFASCVPCDHPLCDEKTSIADEELVGDWLAEVGDDVPIYVSIGRKQDAQNVLEWVTAAVDEQEHVSIERRDVFTTTVQSLRIATCANDRTESEPMSYSFWLLESPDKDTVKVYMMDERALAAAIDAKQLRGAVGRLWLFGWKAFATRIENTPDELREYVAKAGKHLRYGRSVLYFKARPQQH